MYFSFSNFEFQFRLQKLEEIARYRLETAVIKFNLFPAVSSERTVLSQHPRTQLSHQLFMAELEWEAISELACTRSLFTAGAISRNGRQHLVAVCLGVSIKKEGADARDLPAKYTFYTFNIIFPVKLLPPTVSAFELFMNDKLLMAKLLMLPA